MFLLFLSLHAILSPVTKPEKPRSYKGFADFRRKEDDRKDIHRISFLSATARVFVTFHT